MRGDKSQQALKYTAKTTIINGITWVVTHEQTGRSIQQKKRPEIDTNAHKNLLLSTDGTSNQWETTNPSTNGIGTTGLPAQGVGRRTELLI